MAEAENIENLISRRSFLEGFPIKKGNNLYSGEGMELDSDGNINNAEKFKVKTAQGESEGTNVKGINIDGDNYNVESADYWKTPQHTVI